VITLKISYNFILVLIVLGAFFFMPIMSVGEVVTKERAFVDVEKSINYDSVYGTEMVKSGSIVSINIILTNFSMEIDESKLVFYSELEKPGGHISEDGSPAEVLKSGGSYTVKHKEVEEEVVVSWSGGAPDVRKQESLIFLNITQQTTEGEYLLVNIEGVVTSEAIEDALSVLHKAKEEIQKANWTIANATKAGINVEEAETNLNLANVHLNYSLECYNAGRQEDALEAAQNALESAKEAEEKAGATIGFTKYRNYTILAAVGVIAIVALVFWFKMRGKKRGIY